jgi:hypothetical protein
LAVSTDSDVVIEAIDRFVSDFMGVRDGAAAIIELAESQQDCALVQAYAAAMHLYSQATEAIKALARPLLTRAQALSGQVTERERLFITALVAWADSDVAKAKILLERLAASWPRDIISAKIAEFLFFEAPDYQRHLRFMELIATANADLSSFKAMHSFALELNALYQPAERMAHEAIEMDVQTPWAHHTLAHVFLNQGRVSEGISTFGAFAPTWSQHAQVIQGHNTWHLALLYLADLKFDHVMDLYRAHVWGFLPDNVFEQVDAISLLWRVELAGRPLVDEWSEIAAHVVTRANEQVFPFLNAQYIYALGRAGQQGDARHAISLMREFTDRQVGEAAHVWREVGVSLAQACLAFAEENYSRTALLLEPIMVRLPCVGGSDAQNDLFRQTYLVSLIKTKQQAKAVRLLSARIGSRSPTDQERSWFDQVSR